MGVSAIAILAVIGLGGCSTHADQWFEPGSADYGQSGAADNPLTQPTAKALLRAAAQTRERGDPMSASALYHRAYAMEPNNPEALVGLGDVLLEAGETNDAIAAFRAALQLHNGNAAAMQGLGKALIVVDRPEEAAVHFRAALAIRPDPVGYNGLGVALDMNGAHGEAQEAYRHGLAIDAENLSLRNNLGLSLALTGDFDQAISVLRKVAAHPRSTMRARQNLALAYGLSGDSDMAARIASIDLGEADVEANVAYYAWLREQPKRTAALALGRGSAAAHQAPADAGRAPAAAAAPAIKEEASLDGAATGADPLEPAMPAPATPEPEPMGRDAVVGRATIAVKPEDAKQAAAVPVPVLPVIEVEATPNLAAVETAAGGDAEAAQAATPDIEISPEPDLAAADQEAEPTAAPEPAAVVAPEPVAEVAAEPAPEEVTEPAAEVALEAAPDSVPELAYAPAISPADDLVADSDALSAAVLTELAVTAQAVDAGIERRSVLEGITRPSNVDIADIDVADIVIAPAADSAGAAETESVDLFADPSYKLF